MVSLNGSMWSSIEVLGLGCSISNLSNLSSVQVLSRFDAGDGDIRLRIEVGFVFCRNTSVGHHSRYYSFSVTESL